MPKVLVEFAIGRHGHRSLYVADRGIRHSLDFEVEVDAVETAAKSGANDDGRVAVIRDGNRMCIGEVHVADLPAGQTPAGGRDLWQVSAEELVAEVRKHVMRDWDAHSEHHYVPRDDKFGFAVRHKRIRGLVRWCAMRGDAMLNDGDYPNDYLGRRLAMRQVELAEENELRKCTACDQRATVDAVEGVHPKLCQRCFDWLRPQPGKPAFIRVCRRGSR